MVVQVVKVVEEEEAIVERVWTVSWSRWSRWSKNGVGRSKEGNLAIRFSFILLEKTLTSLFHSMGTG